MKFKTWLFYASFPIALPMVFVGSILLFSAEAWKDWCGRGN